jgi:surfactin synthase thioesterase subunit
MTQAYDSSPVRPRALGALSCPLPVPVPSLRLFLFHHAGGSHLLYRGWEENFPADWEVCPLDAPGRGRLHDLPPRESAGALVDYFRDQLSSWLDQPFAFFGHSMGALIAYELTRRLLSEGLPTPAWLGISSCGSPRPDLWNTGRSRHTLSDADLRRWLAGVGGTPTELLENDDLWRIFRPMFRSDFKVVDTWRPDPQAPPLTVPLSVFGADDDPVVGREALEAWADHAEQFLGLHLYEGDHFYLRTHQRPLAQQIVESVAMALRTPGKRFV